MGIDENFIIIINYYATQEPSDTADKSKEKGVKKDDKKVGCIYYTQQYNIISVTTLPRRSLMVHQLTNLLLLHLLLRLRLHLLLVRRRRNQKKGQQRMRESLKHFQRLHIMTYMHSRCIIYIALELS